MERIKWIRLRGTAQAARSSRRAPKVFNPFDPGHQLYPDEPSSPAKCTKTFQRAALLRVVSGPVLFLIHFFVME
jgi:hypothetical protein